MSLELNKKIVSEFLGCFASKDIAGAMGMTSGNFTWWIGGKKELFPLAGVKTKAEITALMEYMMARMRTGLTITVKAMIAEGDKVAVEAESYGVDGDGAIYNNEYHFLVVVRDGAIDEVKEYLDTMHMAHVFLR